jgi:hypothetical protein
MPEMQCDYFHKRYVFIVVSASGALSSKIDCEL